jgi:phospholipase C
VNEKLRRIEHIVVLQLENRSFDHMLGYLALPAHAIDAHPGEFDTDVNGFGGASNLYKGVEYAPGPLDENAFHRHDLDPPHDAGEVKTQIAGGEMSGFVEAWAAKLHKKNGRWLRGPIKRLIAWLRRRPYPDPSMLRAVMGYVTPDKVPVFDHLARRFCVCDNWFCSVPGPTMPNRFFSVAGTHDGEMSNFKLLVFKSGEFKSLFRWLRRQDMWRWYSSDPGILRAIDSNYRFDIDRDLDHFAYFDEWTKEQPRTFLGDVLENGALPAVAWIDPNFAIADMQKMLAPLDFPGSNDDHPPSRVIEAQRLVNKVYEALGRSGYWDNTLLVVYYDEHGGFHDHQAPPDGLGPRIPALVAGGRVKRGVCHEQFDHASLIKTILLRFGDERWLEEMPPDARARVEAATDLSVTLREDDEIVRFHPVENPGPAGLSDEDLKPRFLEQGASKASRAIEILDSALTDLQELIVRYHALPLRTGHEKLPAIPGKRLRGFALRVGRKPARTLPPRRP